MQDIIKKKLADFASSKWTDIAAGLAPKFVYEDFATHERVEGGDAYVKVLQRWKKTFPDLTGKLIDAHVAGNTVIAEVEWEGTQSGPLEGPFGPIAATNKKGRTRAAVVFRFENDKLVEVRQYYDLLTILKNIGIMPALGAPPKAAASARPDAATKH